ncbi:MAG TPA: hypothetical protein VFE23_17800 [Usitatibacter sp.]|nr:hypothetical protein [Usitatibacter sp.]
MQRLIAGLAALGASCLLHAAASTSSSSSAVSTTLEPGKPVESCMGLAAGDKRRWYWKADGPVDFDIHFADGDKVTYALRRDRMRGDGGTFVARTAREYCWKWSATRPARLDAKIEP